ncbi:MAG TPA: PTS sugar transporter subunit IIA [Lacunisphaera sp.]|nr:PTS sugar transporter subunit IIA [Lacunisphaera sp.]
MRSILNALQDGRLFELPDAGKDRALEFLARILDANPDIVVGTDTIEEVKKRERECNTGIGLGVGIPHIRAQREEGELFCAIGWSPPGIDYGAADGQHVHLVVMYYIPGAQKNVYLKEVSILFKAIRKTGGIEPVAHAPDLNAVRNQLLDWVSAAMGETGPEAVARMIKLDVKQTQAGPAAAAAPLPAVPAGAALRTEGKAAAFQVLHHASGAVTVLATDAAWVGALEKDSTLATRLATSLPFSLEGRQVFVVASTPYAAGRVLYSCVAIPLAP